MTLDNTFVYNFGKFRMVLDKHDTDVSRQIQEHGWYVDERLDIEVFQKHLKTGMTFVDLGANVGFYTFLARSIIGQKGRVFAFEPYPRNAELIRASIGENNSFHNNVTLVEAAVSDKNGKASLYLSPDASSENSLLDLEFRYDHDAKKEEGLGRKGQQEKRAITVDVVTVDDYFEKKVGDTKVDFIKMDIEGSEYRAFKGMSNKVLRDNDRMILMLEFWPNGFRKDNHDPYEFLETLAKSPGGGGFDIQLIDNIKQEVYRVGVEEMKRIEKSRMDDLGTQNEFMKIWGWYTNLLCTSSS
jgi:FkbM family methyltransferase